MHATPYNLLLADDDVDDCIFFKEALDELSLAATLATVKDGAELMQVLETEKQVLPDVLFIDLNMPRKNGFDCLTEIKKNDSLKAIPVVIISTSFNDDMIDLLYEKGANYYIRKPGEFSKLKQSIEQAIAAIAAQGIKQPEKESFVLNKLS